MVLNYEVKTQRCTEISDILTDYLYDKYWNNPRRMDCLHPSAISNCGRKAVFDAMFLPKKVPDARTLMVFENGHAIHHRLETLFKKAGIRIEAELALDYPPLNITGHSDSLVCISDNNALVEIKGCKSTSFEYMKYRKKGPSESYYIQLHIYALLANIMYSDQYGIIKKGYIYIENKDTQEPLIYKMDIDFELCDQLEEYMIYLNQCLDAGVMPDIDPEVCNPNGFPCTWQRCTKAGNIKGDHCEYFNECYPGVSPCRT